MARSAKGHLVCRIVWIGLMRVIRRNQSWDIDAHCKGRRLAGEGMCGHRDLPVNCGETRLSWKTGFCG